MTKLRSAPKNESIMSNHGPFTYEDCYSVWYEALCHCGSLSPDESEAMIWALRECGDWLQVAYDLGPLSLPRIDALLSLNKRGILRAQRFGQSIEVNLIRRMQPA